MCKRVCELHNLINLSFAFVKAALVPPKNVILPVPRICAHAVLRVTVFTLVVLKINFNLVFLSFCTLF